MTKIWRKDSNNYTEASILDEDSDRILPTMQCKSLKRIFKSTIIKIRSKRPPVDYLNVDSLFIVSEKLKSILEEFQVPSEYFQLDVIFKGKKYTGQQFFFCNIMDCIACLDFNQGEYEFEVKPGFTDHVRKIKTLAIDEAKVKGHHLFRNIKGVGSLVFASDSLAEKIVSTNCAGVKFNGVENWNEL
jgi:hypothetical protein